MKLARFARLVTNEGNGSGNAYSASRELLVGSAVTHRGAHQCVNLCSEVQVKYCAENVIQKDIHGSLSLTVNGLRE